MPVDEMAAYKEFLKSAVRDAESIEKSTKARLHFKCSLKKTVQKQE